MAFVLWAMAVMIRTDLRFCMEMTDHARMHWKLEQLRCEEEGEQNIDLGAAEGKVRREHNKAVGTAERAGDFLEIQLTCRHPEEVLRRLGVVLQERDRNEKTDIKTEEKQEE